MALAYQPNAQYHQPNAQYHNSLDALNQQNAQYRSSIDTLNQQQLGLNTQNAQYRSPIDSLNPQNAQYRSSIDTLNQQQLGLNSQNAQYRSPIDSLNPQNAQYRSSIDTLNQQQLGFTTPVSAMPPHALANAPHLFNPQMLNPQMQATPQDALKGKLSALATDDDSDHEEEAQVTDIPLPEFVQVFLALTGLSELSYRIQVEREKRQDETFQNPYLEVEEIVMNLTFECLIAGLILVNCMFIGWEASIPDGQLEQMFSIIEHLFTVIFFLEWSLRILAFGWSWIFELTNAADTFLVMMSIFLKWLAEPLGINLGNIRIIMVLRTVRLVKVAKAYRHTHKEMWILIRGMTSSAKPLTWALTIAFSVQYVFATAATEFIGKSENFKDDEYAQELFGNFLRSMFTMTQVITMDTYCDLIIRPIMDVEAWLAVFFIIFVTIGVFIVLNLITAVIVDTAFMIVDQDKDSAAKEEGDKKRRELKGLADLFIELDVDGSGELSREEFFTSLKNQRVVNLLRSMDMKVTELEETWEVLDDGDGMLTIKEFTDGIRRMKGEAKAKDVADVLKKLIQTQKKHHELKYQAKRYSETLHALERDAAEMARDTDIVVDLFKEMYHRLNHHISKDDRANRLREHRQAQLEKLAAREEEEEELESESEDDEEEETPVKEPPA